MKRHNIFLGILLSTLALCSSGTAQNAGAAGAFTRLGSGARGMGMGNAMTAVGSGDLQSSYNPALAALATRRTVSATFSFLAFDRYLNFLNYSQAVKPTAGISLGLINAGVRSIDGRDGDGIHTEDYSTFENQFYLAFANRMDENLTLGIAVKMYYSKLFDQVKNTTVGFDLGIHYRLTPYLNIAAAMQDVSTKYTWDTKAVYDLDGRTTVDKFPQLRRIGVSYTPDSARVILSAEFENSSLKTNIVRMGGEYSLSENFAVRAGIDRIMLNGDSPGAKPTFGFSVTNGGSLRPSLNYAYIVEPFASQAMHILSLSLNL